MDDTERAKFERLAADMKPPLTRSQKAIAAVIGITIFPAALGVIVGALLAAARFLWEYALH